MTPFYYNAFEQGSDIELKKEISNTLEQNCPCKEDIIILCIGTDRATGDCLGPLVGEHLKKVLPEVPVYGTIEQPVHALNLEETIQTIYDANDDPFIIAIDASLGIPEHIGYATLSRNPLIPGKGVNKKLPAIGHISITGIVNVAGFPNSILLQSTRLHTVMTLADCISNAIYWYFTDAYLPAPL
ncbi:MAG: spore protease YyaC [Bacteroidales bacterium]|nr:spore protease YyaC [Clostridium sp.]MCM1203704.1 spore protease YyaC [Bacteroidales bacterium]